MAKTINAYTPDQGEVEIEISAANVAAIAAFTTAESIILDGVVRKFERVNDPERPMSEFKVTGSKTPIVSVGDALPAERWELVIVDDYFEGAAGEWGTDLLSGVEIFYELFKASQDPGGLQCTPAGGATGDIETTLTDPKILSVSHPVIDAEAEDPAIVRIMIAASGSTQATHA